jgi:hypothetical protein
VQAVKRASQRVLKPAQTACRAAGAAYRTRTELGPIAEAIVRLRGANARIRS